MMSSNRDEDEDEDFSKAFGHSVESKSKTKSRYVSSASFIRFQVRGTYQFIVPCNPSVTGATSKGHSRTIIHFDIDCFYAQVEMLKDPSLKDKPLGIQQKNIVVTCNYPARYIILHTLSL